MSVEKISLPLIFTHQKKKKKIKSNPAKKQHKIKPKKEKETKKLSIEGSHIC